MALNRFASEPLYRQLGADLEARLAEQFGPGDRLPSEAELAAEYDVNRLTVRQALADLGRRGLVEAVQGRGTFVAEPPVRYVVDADANASFSHAMQARGHTVQVRLLQVSEDNDPEIRSQLRTRRALRRVHLLRLLDGEPWSRTQTWLAATRFKNLDRHWDGETSLHDVLARHYGVRMVRATRAFSAVRASAVDAEHLAVPVGVPLLAVRGLNVSDEGEPVAVVEHHFRGDRVEFTVALR